MMKTVFLDLDGTLTDPKIGITASIQYALEKLSVEVPSKEELTWCIGPPLLKSLEMLVGSERSVQALNFYRERFADIGWKENTLYPDIVTTLDQLRQAEVRLCIATSKPHVYARKIIEYFEIDRYLEALYGSELNGVRSDKSELLRFALAELQSVDKATMVGDREHDVIGALANGMNTVGVTYGYGSREELVQAGARKIVSKPAELFAALT